MCIRDSPLAAVSSLKKGWAEQADAFGNYLTGKTPDEVKKLCLLYTSNKLGLLTPCNDIDEIGLTLLALTRKIAVTGNASHQCYETGVLDAYQV